MTLNLSKTVLSGPLITTDWANRHFNFYSMDSEEQFLENSKKFRSNEQSWIYFDKSIEYKFNSQGYRTSEWNDINWQESVVIFGCSNVVGEGLAEADTISGVLSRLLDRPVVNLGVSGTSIAFSSYNSAMLCNNLPTPYAIVQLWTALARMELYTADVVKIHTAAQHGHIDTISTEFYRSWISYPENPNTHMFFNALLSKLLCKSKTRYYEASFFLETANMLQCDYITVDDYARDLTHPGINTAKTVATQIANSLK